MTEMTTDDIIAHKEHGSWRKLEVLARSIIEDVRAKTGCNFKPLLGGGTRLMLELDHRISHDIDLFIDNPQIIGFISPRLNDKFEGVIADYEEAADFIKLKFEAGEIDFIVRGSLLNMPFERSPHTTFCLEPLAEVLAKKLFYRGAALTHRDLFDWWSVENMRPQAIPPAEMGRLLEKRQPGISNALDMLSQSKVSKQHWDGILAPNKPELIDVINWGKNKLNVYMAMATSKPKKSSFPDLGSDSGMSL